jgi:hypothetical protein
MVGPKFLYDGVRRVLGLEPPGKCLQIFPDDVFLVSFPKSGNTWTRFLLGNLVSPDAQVTFTNVRTFVPYPDVTPRKIFDRMPRPRLIKSHECFDPLYPRIIYIVRDPRDVVISQFHYLRKVRKVGDDLPIETFVKQFLAGETCPFGSWGQNVMTWLTSREGDPRFLLMRYEDMLADTARELAKVVDFLQLSVTPEQVTQAVERSSPDRMRKLEKVQGFMKGSREDVLFVRAAASGSWRKDLPLPMVEEIEAAWGPVMRHLGYELATQTPTDVRLRAAWNGPPLGFETKAELQQDALVK